VKLFKLDPRLTKDQMCKFIKNMWGYTIKLCDAQKSSLSFSFSLLSQFSIEHRRQMGNNGLCTGPWGVDGLVSSWITWRRMVNHSSLWIAIRGGVPVWTPSQPSSAQMVKRLWVTVKSKDPE
jgi:hypothetical protein